MPLPCAAIRSVGIYSRLSVSGYAQYFLTEASCREVWPENESVTLGCLGSWPFAFTQSAKHLNHRDILSAEPGPAPLQTGNEIGRQYLTGPVPSIHRHRQRHHCQIIIIMIVCRRAPLSQDFSFWIET